MIDDLIKQVMSEKGSDWISMLTSKFGFDADQAKGFIPAAIGKITDLFQGGKLDLASGLNADSILEKLNAKELGAEIGVDADKATAGLKGLVPDLLSSLNEKSGGVGELLSGGLGDAVGKLGKLFD